MPYTIEYANTENPEEKAIQDIRNYLGDKDFEGLSNILRNDLKNAISSIEEIRFTLAVFVGIQGYPVKVWIEKLQEEVKKEQN